jgi:hypothetical protein
MRPNPDPSLGHPPADALPAMRERVRASAGDGDPGQLLGDGALRRQADVDVLGQELCQS